MNDALTNLRDALDQTVRLANRHLTSLPLYERFVSLVDMAEDGIGERHWAGVLETLKMVRFVMGGTAEAVRKDAYQYINIAMAAVDEIERLETIESVVPFVRRVARFRLVVGGRA